MQLQKTQANQLTNPTEFRVMVTSLEEKLRQVPWVLKDRKTKYMCPLKHSFGDGIYVREIFMPKYTFIISALHKITHPYFILSGDVSVMTEGGVVRIKAPYSGMTQAGTKRILYMHEDTVWCTVHVTDKKDEDEILKDITSEGYNEYDDYVSRNVVDVIKEVENL